MKNLRGLLIAVMTIGLASCSLLSPAPVESQNKYILSAVPSVKIKKPHRAIVLLVAEPSTHPFYNTELIAYSTQPYKIGYYAKNTWISRPGEMLQPLIVQSLQNTHYFHAVITPMVSSGYNYTLQTQIVELIQDYNQTQAMLRFSINALLIRTSTNKVIATKQFVITQPILVKTPYGGVYAANRATAEMLRDLTQFCLKNIH